MSRNRRRLALALSAALLLMLCFSFAFIALEAEHDCPGEDCQICLQIARAGALLRVFSLAVCFVVGAAALRLAVSACERKEQGLLPAPTLICWKVRLND